MGLINLIVGAIIIVGMIYLGVFIYQGEKMYSEFCEENGYLYRLGSCYEIRGDAYIEYPIMKIDGKFYFKEEKGDV